MNVKWFMWLMGLLWTIVAFQDSSTSKVLETMDLGISTMWIIASFFVAEKE